MFLLGWLRAPVAWLSVGLLTGSAWVAARQIEAPYRAVVLLPSRRSGAPARWVPLLAGSALMVLVVALSGAGGFGVQAWDWQKHNAVLADLVDQPWPVAYRVSPPAQDVALVYYVAYYLPAAVVGRAAGWLAANLALFLWTAIGAVLAWQWIARLGRASLWSALLVAVLFSGFDLLGVPFAPPRLLDGSVPWWQEFDLEWWHDGFVYPGNVTLYAYAPHQALGGWLATALALEALRRGVRGFPLSWPLTVCLLWSPFAACGLVALLVSFALAAGVRGLRARRGSLAHRQLSLSTLAILAGVALPLVLYFAARVPAPELPPDLRPPPEARDAARVAFLPVTVGVATFARSWARFLAVELLPLVAALAGLAWLARRRVGGADRFGVRLLIAASAVLALLPCVAYGFYNDWAMRVSIPALFALQVLSARALSRGALPIAARRAFAGLVLAAGLYPLLQLWSLGTTIAARGDWVAIPVRAQIDDLFTMQRGSYRYYGFVEQYVARADAPFFRLLAPPLTVRSIAAAPPRREENPPDRPR